MSMASIRGEQAGRDAARDKRATERDVMEFILGQGIVVIDNERAALCFPENGLNGRNASVAPVIWVERVPEETDNVELLRRLAKRIAQIILR